MLSFSKLTGNVRCWPKGLCNMSPQTKDVYLCLKTVTWKKIKAFNHNCLNTKTDRTLNLFLSMLH